MNLSWRLARFVREHALGVVFAAETGFVLRRNPDTVRAPDVAFVASPRSTDETEGFFPGPPDLAVEVVSPSDSYGEVEEKVFEWLTAGTKAVVVIDPKTKAVSLFRSRDDIREAFRGLSCQACNHVLIQPGRHPKGFTRRFTMRSAVGVASLLGAVVIVGPLVAQPVGGEFRVNAYTTGNQGNLPPSILVTNSVAMNSSGAFVIVWTSAGQDGMNQSVFGQRFAASGQALGAEFRANSYTSAFQTEPAIAMDQTGDFVVVWANGPNGHIAGQRFSGAGLPKGAEFEIEADTAAQRIHPRITIDGAGSFVVVWEAGFDLDGSGEASFGQWFDSSGSPLGLEFRINTYTTMNQARPAVAADSMGAFVAVWEGDAEDGSSRGVFGQRFASTGDPTGSEFRVNTFTTYSQAYPAIASTPSGGFVVVWQGSKAPLTSEILGLRYASTGVVFGGEFRVNSYTTYRKTNPSVGADSAGNFVVAWQSYYQDGALVGIFGQRFSSLGVPLGAEFRVNTYVTNSQRFPFVAASGSGDFTVAWESQGQDGSGYGIYAQRFSPIGCEMPDAIPPSIAAPSAITVSETVCQ